MAPFDGPALAAAQLRVKAVNAAGGVRGRPMKIITCDTQGNKPAIAKACAAKLLGQGANIIFTTCDVDLAAPGRPGGDQPGRARGCTVHRHRPDGAEAVRPEGTPRVHVRQRGSGRGLGDGRVCVVEGLAQRGARDRHRDRVLQERRAGVRGTVEATRRQDRGERDVSVRAGRRRKRGVVAGRDDATERGQGRRHRDRDGTALGGDADDHERPPVARQRDAVPQLLGRRRHVLGLEGPARRQLLLRDLCVGLRRRSQSPQ